jgi:hypothetical protein
LELEKTTQSGRTTDAVSPVATLLQRMSDLGIEFAPSL